MELAIDDNDKSFNATPTVKVGLDNVPLQLHIDLKQSYTWVACTALTKNQSDGIDCSTTCPANANKFLPSYGHDEVCLVAKSFPMQLGNVSWPNDRFVIGIGVGQGVMTQATNPALPKSTQGALGLDIATYNRGFFRLNELMDRLDSFAIFLAPRNPTNSTANKSSTLLFNNVDQQWIHQQNLTAHLLPLRAKSEWDDQHWRVSMKALYADGKTISSDCVQDQYCYVDFDMAEPFMKMPHNYRNDLLRSWPQCAYNDQQSRIECPRDDALPTLSFVLGSASTRWIRFDMDPSDYTEDIDHDTVAVYLQGRLYGYTLGVKFLRKFYPSFEVHKGITLHCPPGSCQVDATVETKMAHWYESRWWWLMLVCLTLSGMLNRICLAVARQRQERHKQRSQPKTRLEEDNVVASAFADNHSPGWSFQRDWTMVSPKTSL